MNKKIGKVLAVALCVVLLIGALSVNTFAFAINPQFDVDGHPASTLADAIDMADDIGSVITQDGNTSDFLEIRYGVEITKNITLVLGKDGFSARINRISYTGENAPLFTIKNGGVLTVKYSTFYGNSNAVNTYGGLFRVEKGGALILDGTADEPVVISGCKLTANNSKGGAVYCEQGGNVIVNGVTFANNSAQNGADIYAEQKTDVTIAEGVVVNAAYGESVDINALNLVLNGEIGLVFHTVVPEKYLDGSFKLTSRTSDTVTYKISECEKDHEGRYLAKYDLSSIELSEPVTLTVCDENGDVITSKSNSAEKYGKTLLNDETVTEKEKNVIRTLLNYGHFAQIVCAEFNGWEIGKDYAETAKYADLATDDSVFNSYASERIGYDAKIADIGVQLRLDYKTDMLLRFSTAARLTVLVNDTAAEVEKSEIGGFDYCVHINGISALDLTKEFTVNVNGKITLKLSAMSYCKSAIEQNGENCKNAVKALYEFYLATVRYNGN